MPNGRGSLECCYCTYFRCHDSRWTGYDAAHEAGTCLRHCATLPDTTSGGEHRVCQDFQPDPAFERDSAATADERFAWFLLTLAPGVLYGFEYHYPPNVRPLLTLGGGPVVPPETG